MPIIHVYLYEGRTIDQKRKLAARMTEAVVTSIDAKPENVRIFLHDMARHDCAVAGELVIDNKG